MSSTKARITPGFSSILQEVRREPHKIFTAQKYWIPFMLLSGFISLTSTHQLRMQYSCLKILKNKSKAAELQKCFFFPLDLSNEEEWWTRDSWCLCPHDQDYLKTEENARKIWCNRREIQPFDSFLKCWIYASPQCNQSMEKDRRRQPQTFGSPMTLQMFREDTNREDPARRTPLVLRNGLWDSVKWRWSAAHLTHP